MKLGAVAESAECLCVNNRFAKGLALFASPVRSTNLSKLLCGVLTTLEAVAISAHF